MPHKSYFQKRWLKINPRVILRLLLDSFWHQKRSWFIIAQTCAKSSDLKYFCSFVQNMTYGAFFPLSFCQKIQILYQNLKALRNIDFWNSLSSYMLKSMVTFKISYFSMFLSFDMKLVFFWEKLSGKNAP